MISETKKIYFKKQETLLKKVGASYSNTVKQKLRNAVLFTDSILKSLTMKEFNKKLDRGIAHLKRFPASKAKQMDHHTCIFLEHPVQTI